MGMIRTSYNQKTNLKKGTKLNERIFKKADKDLEGTLLRSSKAENDDEEHHLEFLRHSGTMKRERLGPK